jgi:lysine-specific demethylase 8
MRRNRAPNTIERLHAPPRERFEREYLNRNTPVILTGVAEHWGAMRKWDVDYLERVAGESEVTVHYRKNGSFRDWYVSADREDKRMPFAQLLNLVGRGPGDARYYMTEHSLRQISPELALDVDVSGYVDLTPPWEPLLFVGYDTCMPMHLHASTEAFLCQIHGEKRITLFSPEQYSRLYPRHWYARSPLFSELDGRQIHAGTLDRARYPRFERAVPMEFELRPGEILFIPVHWWHLTSVPGFQISITCFWKAKFRNWTFPVPGLQMCARELLFQTQKLTGRLSRTQPPPFSSVTT